MLKMSDVCDVTDIAYLVAEMLEEFYKNVIRHTGAGMAEMCIAIDGRTADIKTHMTLVKRSEQLFLSRKRIGDI
jgi:hypothetical protein